MFSEEEKKIFQNFTNLFVERLKNLGIIAYGHKTFFWDDMLCNDFVVLEQNSFLKEWQKLRANKDFYRYDEIHALQGTRQLLDFQGKIYFTLVSSKGQKEKDFANIFHLGFLLDRREREERHFFYETTDINLSLEESWNKIFKRSFRHAA